MKMTDLKWLHYNVHCCLNHNQTGIEVSLNSCYITPHIFRFRTTQQNLSRFSALFSKLIWHYISNLDNLIESYGSKLGFRFLRGHPVEAWLLNVCPFILNCFLPIAHCQIIYGLLFFLWQSWPWSSTIHKSTEKGQCPCTPWQLKYSPSLFHEPLCLQCLQT